MKSASSESKSNELSENQEQGLNARKVRILEALEMLDYTIIDIRKEVEALGRTN
jgi:hypothetical protein